MKRLILGLLLASTLGCARIHLPHNPDGSLDTKTLLQWAEAGIAADCAIQGASADVCAIGLPAVTALESKDPKDVRAGLIAITVQHPQTLVYLRWSGNRFVSGQQGFDSSGEHGHVAQW